MQLQAGTIEDSLFQVKIPRTRLLRHQLSLQAVLAARNHPLQMDKLLIQQLAKFLQLLGIAQFIGADRFIKLASVNFIIPVQQAGGTGRGVAARDPLLRSRLDALFFESNPPEMSASSPSASPASSSLMPIREKGLRNRTVIDLFHCPALSYYPHCPPEYCGRRLGRCAPHFQYCR